MIQMAYNGAKKIVYGGPVPKCLLMVETHFGVIKKKLPP